MTYISHDRLSWPFLQSADKSHEVKQDIAAAGQSAQNADSPISTCGPPA